MYFFLRVDGEQGDFRLNWKDPGAVRCFTTLLMKEYMDINIKLDEFHICPAVPNRLNYICWIDELIAVSQNMIKSIDLTANSNPESSSGSLPSNRNINGLDIGVGSSCIYPLLGSWFSSQGSNQWQFVATDIDHLSCKQAAANVSINALNDHITIRHVSDSACFQSFIGKYIQTGGESSHHDPNIHPGFRVDVENMLCAFSTGCAGVEASKYRGPVRMAFGPIPDSDYGLSNANLVRGKAAEEAGKCTNFNFNLDDLELLFVRRLREAGICNSLPCSSVVDACGFDDDSYFCSVDFCMTNPPFYSGGLEDVTPNPSTTLVATNSELYTEGGELAFVIAMIMDSLILRRHIFWYSSMLGKKSSLKYLMRFMCALYKVVPSLSPQYICTTKFIQGSTTRWGFAWCFYDCSSILVDTSPCTLTAVVNVSYGYCSVQENFILQ